MEFITIFITAVALSMDSFSVSMALGCRELKSDLVRKIKIALVFAAFQSGMPVVGYFFGLKLNTIIADFDHWIAVTMLSIIGIKMIVDSFQKIELANKQVRGMVIGSMALVTSIDALAVGIGFGVLKLKFLMVIGLIGLITFLAVLLGLKLGRKTQIRYGRKVEAFGGIVLILIGLKILHQHLLLGI